MDFKAINLTGGRIFACQLVSFYLEARMASICFIPTALKQIPIGHQFILPDLRIFNKPVGIDSNGILKQNILLTHEIQLSYLQNDFSFDFTALNYLQPEKNQYRYKMEGFQNDWVDLGYERKASYTNLSPGEYVLKVMASNNDGVWNEQETFMNIIITPPYWQTWWFKSLVILTAVGITLYGLYNSNEGHQKAEALSRKTGTGKDS